MSCSYESEELEYDCSGETSVIDDTGQFIIVLLLFVLILLLLALCKMCNTEKEELDRLKEEADRIDIATANSIDIELGNIKASMKEEQDTVSHLNSTLV